jgi:hypothetical protein
MGDDKTTRRTDWDPPHHLEEEGHSIPPGEYGQILWMFQQQTQAISGLQKNLVDALEHNREICQERTAACLSCKAECKTRIEALVAAYSEDRKDRQRMRVEQQKLVTYLVESLPKRSKWREGAFLFERLLKAVRQYQSAFIIVILLVLIVVGGLLWAGYEIPGLQRSESSSTSPGLLEGLSPSAP